MYRCFWQIISFPSGKYLLVEFLDHLIILFLIFKRISVLLFIMALVIYFPISGVPRSFFFLNFYLLLCVQLWGHGEHVNHDMKCVGQRTTWWSWLFPTLTWILGIELKLSSLYRKRFISRWQRGSISCISLPALVCNSSW